jgi:hypothetical protein
MRKTFPWLAGITVLSVSLAGCGSGATRHFDSAPDLVGSIAGRAGSAGGARGLPGAPVRYRETGYGPAVYDPGGPNAFAVFATSTREITVQPSSAATVRVVKAGRPKFTTRTDQAHWRAAGSPALDSGPAAGQVTAIPAGQFSFVPQVNVLTYQQASSLPATPDGVYAAVLAHSKSAATDPPATLLLRQFAFLLAVAPLPRASRPAAWNALLKLRGLHLCGHGTDLAGRRGDGLCVDDSGYETEMLVDPGAGSVLAVLRRITRPSVMYPHVPAGSLVEVDTFVAT